MEVREVLKVKDSALFAVHPDSPLSEAVIMMAENDIGCVVVMDGGKLVGVVTFREVLQVLAKRQTERRVGPTPPIAEILVSEAMHANPPTAHPAMDLDELRRLMEHLRKHFHLLDDDSGDYGIEIDPREADWSTMGLLRELGFNRVSLGVQDLDPNVQRAINRLQTLEQTRAIVEAAHTLQYRSVNIDLIYGLPLQNPESFARTVAEVIALQPDRLSVFNYAHLPERFMPQRRINESDLPSPAQKLEMLQRSIEQLTAAGYRYIGMDHFALPDDELAMAQEDGTLQRNFQGYTTHGHCDLIGLGVSAISQVGDLYSQNSSDLANYQQSLANGQLATQRGLHCNADDRIRRAVIQALICQFQLDFGDIEQRFAIDFRSYFSAIWPQLQQLDRDGLIELGERGIEVRPAGRLLVRSVCMLFDHYLEQQNQQRFSRVI